MLTHRASFTLPGITFSSGRGTPVHARRHLLDPFSEIANLPPPPPPPPVARETLHQRYVARRNRAAIETARGKRQRRTHTSAFGRRRPRVPLPPQLPRGDRHLRGEGEEAMGAAGEEGVMATDFFWSYTDEPHASRRREILAKYPQIKDLFGPDPWALLKIAAVVSLQLWTATFLRDASWLKILTVAYFFGSFLNHNLFLAIHELSHNLAFTTPSLNRWLGIFSNLPIGVPMSVTFQKYHLEHHRFQGVDGVDMDIPSQAEAHAVKNTVSKCVWVMLQLFFYALRPLFLKPKPPGLWEFTNLAVQVALDASLVYLYGWKSLGYLILSTFVGGGMHPMAGHFISEHYVFSPEQETYSYYGPLNLMTWHVGYHNEHHDFPRIPGTRLHKVKEIAPEYYRSLKSYRSWSQVIYMYIMDQTVGPFSRMKRKAPKKDS